MKHRFSHFPHGHGRFPEGGPFRAHGGHRRHGGGGRGGRLFDYGELRLLLLAMIAENPAHGYELIKAIEERLAGAYAPSPGTVYPTLSWLDDMGYARIEEAEGNRKRYHITDEGAAFLEANRETVDALMARTGEGGGRGRREGVPPALIRAMENLRMALRLRVRQGPIDPETATRVADILDEAARTIERGA